MHLHHLGVAVFGTGLVAARCRSASADHAHGALAEDQPIPARGDYHCVGREAFDLHRAHVLADNSDTLLVVNYRPEEFPELVLCDLAFGFVATDLLIERIKKLLPRSRAGEKGSFEE